MQNPRPRKYASDAERQAAYRNRASMVEFRADEKTAEKLTEIATTLDISRSDLLLSMVKFALTNHQWARFGLTHKTLPRYEENPMATKKFSPAQIAAQKLFAERARAGTLGKGKRKAAVKRRANPMTPRGFVIADDYTREIFNPYGAKPYDAVFMRTTKEPGFSPYDLTILKSSSGEFIAATGSKVYQEKFTTAAAAANWLANWYKENKQKMYRGVKTNPDKDKPNVYIKRVSQATGAPPTKRLVKRRTKALFAPAGYFPNPEPTHDFARIGKPFAFDGRTWKVSQYSHNGKTIEAYTTDRKKFVRREFDVSELMSSRRKLNPTAAMMTGYQVICMHPKKHVVGIFKTMAEARMVATAMADAKGVPYGVKAVKVHKTHFAV